MSTNLHCGYISEIQGECISQQTLEKQQRSMKCCIRTSNSHLIGRDLKCSGKQRTDRRRWMEAFLSSTWGSNSSYLIKKEILLKQLQKNSTDKSMKNMRYNRPTWIWVSDQTEWVQELWAVGAVEQGLHPNLSSSSHSHWTQCWTAPVLWGSGMYISRVMRS